MGAAAGADDGFIRSDPACVTLPVAVELAVGGLVALGLVDLGLLPSARTGVPGAARGTGIEAGSTTTDAAATTGPGPITAAGTITEAGAIAVAGAATDAGATGDNCGRALDAFPSLAPFVEPSPGCSGCEKPLRTVANAAGGRSFSSCGAGVTAAAGPAAIFLSLVWLSLLCFVRGCVRVVDGGAVPPGPTANGRRPECGLVPAGVADVKGTVQGGGAETVTQRVQQMASQKGEPPFSFG